MTRTARNPHVTRNMWRAPNGQEYPIRDARHGIKVLIQPTKKDIAGAKPGDVNRCAIARAWKRQTNVPVAQVGIYKCYLPMRQKGELVALRLSVPRATRIAIDHFDKTGEFPSEGFVLSGISPSQRMTSRRADAKRLRIRWATLGHTPSHRRKRRFLRHWKGGKLTRIRKTEAAS